MGQGESSELAGIEGFQIVRVAANSPAHVSGLVPFFDFITAVDNLPLDRDAPRFFFDYVSRNKDKSIIFRVFNLRVRANRDLTITPTDAWGGTGLLGCNVNWEDAEKALESTWHVVEVTPRSPAYTSGFMAQRDFIIGMQPVHDPNSITLFRDSGDFHGRIEEWRMTQTYNRQARLSMILTLMVFDAVDNAVKELAIDLSGTISLGVDVANGYLHMIPASPAPADIPVLKRIAPATTAAAAAAAATAVPAIRQFPQVPAGVETVPSMPLQQPIQVPPCVPAASLPVNDESAAPAGYQQQALSEPSPHSPPPSLVSPLSAAPRNPPPTPTVAYDRCDPAALHQQSTELHGQLAAYNHLQQQQQPQQPQQPQPQQPQQQPQPHAAGVPQPLPYPTASSGVPPPVVPLPFPQPPPPLPPTAFPPPPAV